MEAKSKKEYPKSNSSNDFDWFKWEYSNLGNLSIDVSSQWITPYPKPDHIIFNNPETLVYWTDGTMTRVKVHNDKFTKEYGLAMAYMRKIYGTRGAFLNEIKSGYKVKK